MSVDPVVGILVGSESDRERMQGAFDELDQRGIAYEFEVRSAHRDPETQAIVPRLEGDLLELLHGAATGRLAGNARAGDKAAVTVALAAPDYPERNDVGSRIEGIEEAEATGTLVFHAGTAMRGDHLVTNGGRILNVTGVGEDLAAARAAAYEGAARISFAGMRYRTDIAAGAEARVG